MHDDLMEAARKKCIQCDFESYSCDCPPVVPLVLIIDGELMHVETVGKMVNELRSEIARLRAELETTKTCLFQAQDAAIERTKKVEELRQLARDCREQWADVRDRIHMMLDTYDMTNPQHVRGCMHPGRPCNHAGCPYHGGR